MKIISTFLLSCILTTAFCAPNDINKAGDMTQNIDKQSVLVDLSTHKAQVNLSSTPSTGYSWFVKSVPVELFDNIEYQYNAPDNSGSAVGRSGIASFSFTLSDNAMTVPRLIPVVLTNARPWQPNDGMDKTIWLVVPAS